MNVIFDIIKTQTPKKLYSLVYLFSYNFRNKKGGILDM